MNAITEEIIIRTIQGIASQEDIETLNKWLKEDKRNISYYFQLEEIWASKNKPSQSQIDKGWGIISKQISVHSNKKHHINHNKSKFIPTWSRYAAAIVIGVLLSTTIWLSIYNHNKHIDTVLLVQNTIHNKTGVHHINLPDNSEVWLNDESEITFPNVFEEGKRKVVLKGKAFFDIKKDNNNPFIVQIGNSEIEVLGTEFFVDAIEPEKSIITLISGSINLHHNISDINTTSVSLIPGEQAVINNLNTTIDIKSINTDYYVAFKDGTYRFTDERLDIIMPMLAEHFNLKIEVAPSLKDKRFTGRIVKDQNVESVLNSISKSYPIKYRISNNYIYIYE